MFGDAPEEKTESKHELTEAQHEVWGVGVVPDERRMPSANTSPPSGDHPFRHSHGLMGRRVVTTSSPVRTTMASHLVQSEEARKEERRKSREGASWFLV